MKTMFTKKKRPTNIIKENQKSECRKVDTKRICTKSKLNKKKRGKTTQLQKRVGIFGESIRKGE